MKKMLLGLFMAASVSAHAFDLEVVTTSTLKGPQGAVINNIAEKTAANGFKVTARQTGGCGEAVSYFENATGPVGIVWSDSMFRNSKVSGQNCVIDFAKARAVMVTYAPYDICVRKGFKLEKGAQLLYGNNKFNPQESQIQHMNGNNLGIRFKNVTFGGSGPTLAGLINKEIDVGFIASANAAKAIESGSIECPYSTGSSRFGQRPLSELTGVNRLSQFSLGMMFFVKNVSDADVARFKAALSGIDATMVKQDLVGNDTDITASDLEKFLDGARFQTTLK